MGFFSFNYRLFIKFFILNRFSVCFNAFVFFSLVNPCILVTVQPCMVRIPIKNAISWAYVSLTVFLVEHLALLHHLLYFCFWTRYLHLIFYLLMMLSVVFSSNLITLRCTLNLIDSILGLSFWIGTWSYRLSGEQ